MALDVTSRSSLSTSEPLQSLMSGPISNGSIEHILHNSALYHSPAQSGPQQAKSIEDATLFLSFKAAAAAAAAVAAAAATSSETAASPCPTNSSQPGSPKSESPSLAQQTSNEADDSMGRPGSISPSQPLALTGHRSVRISASPCSPANVGSTPLEKLQSLSPNTITMGNSANNGDSTRSLKFSIDNILSPDFGKNEHSRALIYNYYQQIQERYSSLNLVKSNGNIQASQKLSFDINTLVSGKRKRSDSESSTVSSLSNNSKEASITNHHTASLAANNSPLDGTNKRTTASPTSSDSGKTATLEEKASQPIMWPAWVYCTRYSDRPSSGPRSRKIKKKEKKDEKRPRTAFTAEQLARLKQEFQENRYLNEKRRQDLARELKLNESQIKIWFQNKRAKIKKSTGSRNPLALHLMAQGLYNHSTMAVDSDDEFDESFKSPSPQSESSKTS